MGNKMSERIEVKTYQTSANFVVLDRDGVINEDSDNYIKSPNEWKPIKGSLEAIAHLNQAGYRVVIATNQSGIARGLYDMNTLNVIHTKMIRMLAQVGGQIDAIFFCPHHPDAGCDCRKPKPGMLLEIANRFHIDLEGLPFVGDSLRDLQAAANAEMQPILVLTGKGDKTSKLPELPDNTLVFPNLMDVAKYLIKSKDSNY